MPKSRLAAKARSIAGTPQGALETNHRGTVKLSHSSALLGSLVAAKDRLSLTLPPQRVLRTDLTREAQHDRGARCRDDDEERRRAPDNQGDKASRRDSEIGQPPDCARPNGVIER